MTEIIARLPFYLGGARPEVGEVTTVTLKGDGRSLPATLVPAGPLNVPPADAARLIRQGWCRALGKGD